MQLLHLPDKADDELNNLKTAVEKLFRIFK